jgi:hypothetical protein
VKAKPKPLAPLFRVGETQLAAWSDERKAQYAKNATLFANLSARAKAAPNAVVSERLRGQLNSVRLQEQNQRSGSATPAEARQLKIQGEYIAALGNLGAQQEENYNTQVTSYQQQLALVQAEKQKQEGLFAEIRREQEAVAALEKARADREAARVMENNSRVQLFSTQAQNVTTARQQFRRQQPRQVVRGAFQL